MNLGLAIFNCTLLHWAVSSVTAIAIHERPTSFPHLAEPVKNRVLKSLQIPFPGVRCHHEH